MKEKLKTLSPKDTYETARAKAVKWVKYYDTFPAMRKDGYIQGFIMKFFNLTEEDLS